MNDDDLTARRPPSQPFGMPGDADLSDDPRVAQVVEEYLNELEAGRRPERSAYENRYPELAGAVAECIDGLELLHSGIKSNRSGPAPSTPMQTMHPAERLGDFQIVRELARGGMGIVYEAVQLSLGRPVALKVLPFAATVDSRQLQRFRIEAQAAALLHHTHIVPIYAVGCERGVNFYAMQLIDGQSLSVVIAQLREKSGKSPLRDETSADAPSDVRLDSTCDLGAQGPATSQNIRPQSQNILRPPKTSEASRTTAEISAAMTAGANEVSSAYVRRVSRLMIQAADALAHAHQAGVVHRDIKPANLLLDAHGELWITDFGLALLQTDNGLTRSGDVLGTFRYMSPEQTGGQRTLLDHRTDIYSLGVTFYELLTLEPAFAGPTHQELLYQILHTEPRSPRQLNRAIPPELETIVLKSLSKSPADRYATAAEFAADIQRFLDHQPIRARRPSLLDRTAKWSRRHPSLVAAGVLLLVVIAAASLISNRLIATEQKLTSEALDREKKKAVEAEDRFQQAREAVDSLFQVSEEELADKPFDGARQRILEIVLSHYQDFIEQRRGDPASQAELAAVQDKVKRILHDLTLIQREKHLLLLDNKAVLEDLHLDESQQEKLQTLTTAWGDERRTFFSEWTGMTDSERQARMVTLAEAHEQALSTLFSPAQRKRFEQISIQREGLFAFKNPDVMKALNLTTEQRSAIRGIEREMFSADRAYGGGPFGFRGPGGPGGQGFGGPGGPGGPDEHRPGGPKDRLPEQRFERRDGEGDRPPKRFDEGGPGERKPGPPPNMRTPARQWVAKALALLSPAQLLAWKELTGQPFMGFDRDGARIPEHS